MLMRLKLPELLTDRGLTAYAVAKASNGRIVEASLYRLMKQRGRVEYVSSSLVQALAEVLDVGLDDVLELDPPRRKRG